MTFISMIFLLMIGTAIQSLVPAFWWTGYASFPVLCSLVLYFALYRGGATALIMAILAGLFQDSISLIPLGYSSFGFAVSALIIDHYRELIMLNSAFTHMVLAAFMHALVTILLMLFMLGDGVIVWNPLWFLLKIPGAVLLGLMVGPWIVGAAQVFEEKLGLVQGREERHGFQRSFYGLG